MSIASFLFVGLVAGWVVNQILEGRGLGLSGDYIIGMTGATIGGFGINYLGKLHYGFWSNIATAVFGATVLLVLVSFIPLVINKPDKNKQ